MTGQINRLKLMKQVQASAAKAHLAELLDEVERGETIVITRHGKRIARLVPEQDRQRDEVRRAIAEIKALRKQSKPVTVEEILAWRDEGRK
jgi:prevent-host-death family protein